MNRRSQAKDASHRRIRATASRMLRRDGIEATSVHKVMSRSGLTVGGFYAHFDSRQQMIRHAFIEAVKQRRDVVKRLFEGRGSREWLPCFLESYLSVAHVEDRDNGCAWAALLSELPRADTATRRMAQRLFESSVRFYAETMEEPARAAGTAGGKRAAVPSLSPREAALSSLALAFGHLNLARMAVDQGLRDEILSTGLKAASAVAAAAGRSSR